MNEMTLPSRHRMRNSSPGGLRPSTLPLGHGGFPQYILFTTERGRSIFVSLKLEGQSGVRARDLRGSFYHCTRAPALGVKATQSG